MRKFIFLIVLFSSFIVTGQVEFKPGVKAGLNVANITHTNFEVKSDFYVGVLFGLKFSEIYTLQPEVLYSRQGARPKLDGGSDFDIELEYLSLGFANKFLLFKGVKLHTVVGPFFDIKTKDNLDYSNSFDIFGNFDVGFFVGLDYEFSSGLGIDLRYKMGLVDLGGIDVNSVRQHNNKVFQFGLSYNFKF